MLYRGRQVPKGGLSGCATTAELAQQPHPPSRPDVLTQRLTREQKEAVPVCRMRSFVTAIMLGLLAVSGFMSEAGAQKSGSGEASGGASRATGNTGSGNGK
jgi:hypothetical protein